MEPYGGAGPWPTETYMIPGTGSNPNLTSTQPPIQELDPMVSGVAPEFLIDQSLYYPTAANCYGYYCTGFEPTTEWDGHQRFFGIDGQEFHAPGLQTEGLQYVYYAPNFGYAQSPYNPYNPYIPGAVIGSDSPFVGTHQYIASPAYHQPVSSPAYFPVVLQPAIDITPTVSPAPSLVNNSGLVASVPDNSVTKGSLRSVSVAPVPPSLKEVSHPSSDNLPRLQETSRAHVPSTKPSMHQGAIASSSAPRISQGRSYSSSETPSCLTQTNDSPLRGSLKVSVPAPYRSTTDFGSNYYGWAPMNRIEPKFQFNGLVNGNGNSDYLGEQNRGPRTSRPKVHTASSIVVKAYTTKAGAIDAHENIVIDRSQYNKEDFSVSYANAKFLVIKSYSEDDVHKSIKYNVWSSTPNGNKRLEAAYEDAQRIVGSTKKNCPVFLFFSVNASGQFCGVAEMIGHVDFNKDMDFWQQDKWTGSFPVKWHIVKDVPNASFRHIVLENNENRPVTNSRDTQEILYIPGLNMLSIFKHSPLRTSILDDFVYYEDRQKIIHEEKSRLHGRNFESPVSIPPSVPNRVTVTIRAPPNPGEMHVGSTEVTDSPDVVRGGQLVVSESGKDVVVAIESDATKNANGVSALMKMESLSIGTKNRSAVESTEVDSGTSTNGVFTVGSMPIKVNGFGELSREGTNGPKH